MNFATANNSVLEALSMERPAQATSTLDGKYEYSENNHTDIQIVSINFLKTLSDFLEKSDSHAKINEISVRNFAIINF